MVSRTRLPPPPKASSAMKKARLGQLGMAPATMQATEQMKSETLNAYLRPMTSAPKPQKSAPVNIPTYTAMVKAFL